MFLPTSKMFWIPWVSCRYISTNRLRTLSVGGNLSLNAKLFSESHSRFIVSIKPENKDALANILKYHVTPGNYSKDFLKKFKKLGQANNQYVKVEVVDAQIHNNIL